jgi:DNA-nicking Smr family endonuclease
MSDLSAAPRRKRALSEEERALWDSVAKQVKPLRKHRAAKAQAPQVETQAVAKPAVPPKSVPARVVPAPKSAPPLAPLGRRERSKLSRGKQEIDARLDLHGMTQTRAHRVLFSFLQRAHSDGCTFVLVITGKGKAGSDGERGVPAPAGAALAEPAEFRALVVGFEEAHIGHGGEGAPLCPGSPVADLIRTAARCRRAGSP